jgi:hypothetical protein
MLVKKTSKNRITLPKAIARQMPDVTYFEVTLRKGEIILKPVPFGPQRERLRAVRAKIKALRITRRDVQRAIRWARHRPN